MNNELNKYKKQAILYIVSLSMILVFSEIYIISKFTFSELPLLNLILFIISLVLIFIIYKTQIKLARNAYQAQESQITVDENSSDVNNEKAINVEMENNEQLNKDLLAGITKKTSKKAFFEKFLSNLIKELEADVGLFYKYNKKTKSYIVSVTYAFLSGDKPPEFKPGEGLNGQVVKNKKAMIITEIPDNYLSIVSGLGKGKPKNLFIYPVVFDNTVFGVIELASLREFKTNFEKELTLFFNANHDKFLNIEDN